MATESRAGNPLGPTGDRLRSNIQRVRTERKMSFRELGDRLDELGRPIAQLGLSRIERGERRVDADDLVALALALRVNSSTLLLPDHADDRPVALTPNKVVDASNAWQWADGHGPLVPGADEPDVPYAEAQGDWERHARPVELRGRRQGTAAQAASDVAFHIDQLLAERSRVKPWPVEGGLRQQEAQKRPVLLRTALERLRAEVDYLLESGNG